MFRKDQNFTEPGQDGSEVLLTDEYMELICLSKRMVDMRTHACFLKQRQDHAKSLVDLFQSGEYCEDDGINAADPPKLLQYDDATDRFIPLYEVSLYGIIGQTNMLSTSD